MCDSTDASIEAAIRKDPAAVEDLFQRYLPRVRAYLRLRAGSVVLARESASDLAQSVCRDVLQHMDRYQYNGEDGFRRWLFKTAQRKIADRYDYYQAQRRTADREDAKDLSDTVAVYGSPFTPSHHAIARERLQQLEAAIEGLPELEREMFVQCKVMGLSRASVAAEHGLSEGAVRMRLHRALARLAEAIAE